MEILQNYNVELNLRSRTFDDQWKPVVFKEDGQRFRASASTVKLCCDMKYVIDIRIEPKVTLDWWWIDVQEEKAKSKESNLVCSYAPGFLRKSIDDEYQYTAIWNAQGMEPSRKGDRAVVNVFFQGPKFSISKQLQCKFYSKDDWHADYGHACGGIAFNCALTSDGDIAVKDERFKFAKGYAQRRLELRRHTI